MQKSCQHQSSTESQCFVPSKRLIIGSVITDACETFTNAGKNYQQRPARCQRDFGERK